MSGQQVFIGCKMPNGVVLDLKRNEIVNKDFGTVRQVGPDERVTLKGTATKHGEAPPPMLVNGYAFTPVPADFWMAWLAQNATSSLLDDGYIIEAATLEAGHAMAQDRVGIAGQFERLTEKDARTRSLGVEKFDKAA